MKPTRPQFGWLLKLHRVGEVLPAHAGYRLATIKACESRGWCELKNRKWQLTLAGLSAINK